jgi:ribosomal protein S12 methylthiotransferase accessory factor
MAFFPMVRFQGVYKPQWSGGLAAGAELRDAVLQGLMERIEHDAWAVWQLNRIPCPRIDAKTIPDADVQNWLEHVRQKGFDIIIRDKRTELRIPTFRVWIINRESPRVFAARGDGANPDPIVALKRAMTEAQHKLAVEDESTWQRMSTRPSLQLFEEELSLHHLSGLAPFELEEIGTVMDFGMISGYTSNDVSKDIRNTVERITAHIPGAEIAVVDLTNTALGIPVVRVITSGLQEMAKPWTHVLPRTFRLPVTFGYYREPLTYAQLYHGPFPH